MNIALKASHPRAEILALTGLRAVAAIAVVIHHIELPGTAPQWMRMIAQCGFIGVPLFFMLSGFVLAYNYPGLQPTEPKKLLRFWIARIARVMPLYWAVLVWAVLMREIKGIPQDRTLWMQFLAIQTWSGDQRVGAGIYNGPGWSICVELFLYLLFPFLVVGVVAVARRWGTRGLVALAAAAFAVQLSLWVLFVVKGWANLPAVDPQSAHRWLYRTPLTRLPEFVVGMVLAFLFSRGVRFGARTSTVVQVAVTVGVPVVCALRDPTNGPLGAAFFGTLWTIPFALLMFSLATDTGPVARVLASRPMVMLGTASYALYITHRGLLPGFGQQYVQTAGGIWGYVMVLIVLAWTLLIAEGAHRYVELPARKHLLAWVDRWVLPRREKAAVRDDVPDRVALDGTVSPQATTPDPVGR